MTKEFMLAKIMEILVNENNLWIIDKIYRFSVNMTKDEKGGDVR